MFVLLDRDSRAISGLRAARESRKDRSPSAKAGILGVVVRLAIHNAEPTWPA